MANERVLIAAAIERGWLDAQSETPGVALPARLWLLDGANGWLDELDRYHDMIRLVGSLDPLPQSSFYEVMSCTDRMVAHVRGWAMQRGT